MRLTLPYEGDAIALPVPSVMLKINGRYAGFHEVTPAAAEIPFLGIINCTKCGVIDERTPWGCESPVCPSRPRKAA